MIEELLIDREIIIAFDNSMTHHAKVSNGLDMNNLKISDGISSYTKANMKTVWYFNESGEEITQSPLIQNYLD